MNTNLQEAFISHSHKDKAIFDRLDVALAQIKRDRLISVWSDRKLLPGANLHDAIFEGLESCGLFLALVSPDFLASDYCYKEMEQALERKAAGNMHVVPIIARPCDWKKSPLGSCNALPDDGQPISTWKNDDEAYVSIAFNLRKLLAANPDSKREKIPPKEEEGEAHRRVKAMYALLELADIRLEMAAPDEYEKYTAPRRQEAKTKLVKGLTKWSLVDGPVS